MDSPLSGLSGRDDCRLCSERCADVLLEDGDDECAMFFVMFER